MKMMLHQRLRELNEAGKIDENEMIEYFSYMSELLDRGLLRSYERRFNSLMSL